MKNYELEFSNLVKAFRKKSMGKGPVKVTTTFCKHWAICELVGNLTPVEKFIAQEAEGKQIVRSARTEMVKEIYKKSHPLEIETLLDAKLVDLFVDINIDRDVGISVFVFDQNIEEKFRVNK
ncbi:DUF2294 domain-containing protein [Thermoflavimicrobium daqui]|uniref:Na+-translocating membrane potential-generating system MpsC domain-containing protein n=1 Tax=Thermoflavimicrobium daqui TaxID=2137476 RepID=A0A364K739_9BACL|nr:DUF2294 domain-containing protein [Thermoflavimicrobium daqui]RAL26097.1 hypothetical protein DL897_03590 [Thermoflavimicrobium daqui]